MNYLVNVLYIVAFGLFILGLSGLTGPKTAVRGNWIAATGMGIAVVATLIKVRDTASINWILIVAGLVIGVVLGVPPAKKTKMTAMPQLVALFNGVGGGTVALIAWAEFIETDGFSRFKADQSPTVALVVGSLFAAIIGSVSFWGSLVAFAKLQESIPKNVEKKLVAGAKFFQAANIVLLIGAVAAAVYIGLNAHPGQGSAMWWIVLVLGNLPADAGWGVRVIAFVALVFGTLNVIGGFLVTDRMLEMFKSKPAPKQTEEGEQ